ncbi:hypothetical protein KF913_06660 [Candidatus Obscuribacterales bacterium]|nr:hypothetical protein [Candidatus Obscuribacterales bacterium]
MEIENTSEQPPQTSDTPNFRLADAKLSPSIFTFKTADSTANNSVMTVFPDAEKLLASMQEHINSSEEQSQIQSAEEQRARQNNDESRPAVQDNARDRNNLGLRPGQSLIDALRSPRPNVLHTYPGLNYCPVERPDLPMS